MLDACHDIGIAAKISLITFHHGLCDLRTQIGIFSVPFCDTAPTRVPGNIHHRRKGPANSISTGFGCGNTGAGFNFLHVPTATQGQRDWENGFISVNHIHTEDQRNFQPALLNRHFLNSPDFHYGFYIKKPSHFSFFYLLSYIGIARLAGNNIAGSRQIELTQFFLKGHFLHQVRNEGIHFWILCLQTGNSP